MDEKRAQSIDMVNRVALLLKKKQCRERRGEKNNRGLSTPTEGFVAGANLGEKALGEKERGENERGPPHLPHRGGNPTISAAGPPPHPPPLRGDPGSGLGLGFYFGLYGGILSGVRGVLSASQPSLQHPGSEQVTYISVDDDDNEDEA